MKTFSRMKYMLFTCGMLAAGLSCSRAGAAELAGADNAGADEWHFTVSPVIGAAGFRGNGAVGPLAGHLRMPFHRVARDTRFAAAGSLEADRGPWSVWLSGQYLNLSQDIGLGEFGEGHAKAHAIQIDLGGAWRAWSEATGGTTVHGGATANDPGVACRRAVDAS